MLSGEEKKMKDNEFKCAICHGVFEKLLSDEEAEQQLNKEFPGFTSDECDYVCDDCYIQYFK